MEEVREFAVPAGDRPARLDLYLAELCPDLTRSALKRLCEEGQIRVDGRPAKAGERLKGGEEISVVLPPPEPVTTQAEAIPLAVLYEDAHLIVIDKPAGLVVHPAPGHSGGTLVNALLHHCRDLAGIGGELRPGIVHRLDKETSGVMVATKDDATHLDLARQFRLHSIRRRYVALVHGLMPQSRGTIDQPIGRHPVDRKRMSGRSRSGRRAVTHWQVLRSYPEAKLSLVELTLETGRTHQIRVHLSEMNHPLVGDPVYGQPGRGREMRDSRLRALIGDFHRQALHARLLGFVHPVSREELLFCSPLAPDLAALITALDQTYYPDSPFSLPVSGDCAP